MSCPGNHPQHSTRTWRTALAAWILAVRRRLTSAPTHLLRRLWGVLYTLLARIYGRDSRKGSSANDRRRRKDGKEDPPSKLEATLDTVTICASNVPLDTHMLHPNYSLHTPVQGRASHPDLPTTSTPGHPYHSILREGVSRSTPNFFSSRPAEHHIHFDYSHPSNSLASNGAGPSQSSETLTTDSDVPQITSQAPTPLGSVSELSRTYSHPHSHPYLHQQEGSNLSHLYYDNGHLFSMPAEPVASARRSVLSIASIKSNGRPPSIRSNRSGIAPRPITIHSIEHDYGSTVGSPMHSPLPSPVEGPLNSLPFASASASASRFSVATPAHSIAFPSDSRLELQKPARDRIIFPMTPAWSERYHRSGTLEKNLATYIVEPMTRSFARKDVPSGWVPHVHPEGLLFFYNKDWNTITDAYIPDPDMLEQVTSFYDQVENLRRDKDIILPAGSQLVLELMPSDDEDTLICGYYFVDHKNKCLFWLDIFDQATWLIQNSAEAYGTICPSHFAYLMESQYWQHREYFPGMFKLTKKDIKQCKALMAYYMQDHLTSPESTSPYDVADLEKLSWIMEEMKDHVGNDKHADTCLGRIMCVLMEQKFINYHGQKHARLNRTQSIYVPKGKNRSLFLTVLSPILFSSPEIHKRDLAALYADRVMNTIALKKFMEKLRSQYNEFLLLGEVMLTVNVSFLAIPSVDTTPNGQNANPFRSWIQILSYLSTTATLGSIIVGLLLVRQNHTKRYADDAGPALEYLKRMENTVTGLDTLAIIYSLPYALLMWGLVTFVVAFAGLCFWQTELTSQISVGAFGLIIYLFTLWCVWATWESREDNSGVLSLLWTSINKVFEVNKPFLESFSLMSCMVKLKLVKPASSDSSEVEMTHVAQDV